MSYSSLAVVKNRDPAPSNVNRSTTKPLPCNPLVAYFGPTATPAATEEKKVNNQQANQLPQRINIAIDADSLAKVLAKGSITVSEMRGLDMQAQQSLRRLCLEACL